MPEKTNWNTRCRGRKAAESFGCCARVVISPETTVREFILAGNCGSFPFFLFCWQRRASKPPVEFVLAFLEKPITSSERDRKEEKGSLYTILCLSSKVSKEEEMIFFFFPSQVWSIRYRLDSLFTQNKIKKKSRGYIRRQHNRWWVVDPTGFSTA